MPEALSAYFIVSRYFVWLCSAVQWSLRKAGQVAKVERKNTAGKYVLNAIKENEASAKLRNDRNYN